jgi:hypothetical protein
MDKLRFFIQNIQATLFIENFAFRNKVGIVSKINEAVDNLFDGDPTMLPLPIDAPPEIPRIQLKDSKPMYSLNFSPTRIDFFYNEPGIPEKNLDSLKDDYLKYFFNIVKLVKDEYRLSIPRIATVVKATSEIETGSNLLIYENFLGSKPFFKNTYSLEIHSLEKTIMNGYDINRWFRIKTARAPAGKDNILFVEIDINTLQDKPRDFGLEEIKDFYNKSIVYAKNSFSSCFGVSL